MKSKILLGTLLGGALLAACTADDALDVREVAGGMNPAAPVFTVSFNGEDDVTRAIMGTGEITWEATDKMSLYHGGQIDGADDFFPENVYARSFNAVYYGSEGAADGQRKFTTQANVNEGAAIMIYPADLTNNPENKSQNPLITIDPDQNVNTKNLTPHISEVLNILKWEGKDDAHEAGYGRNYDIVMRRIGAQMRLALKAINDEKLNDVKDVPDVEFKRVTVGVKNKEGDASYPFTIKSEVKIGKLRNGENLVKKEDLTKNSTEKVGTGIVGTNPKEHKYWAFTPWIEPAKGGTVEKISTRDVEDLVAPNNKEYPTALFTLLPLDDTDETGVFDNTTKKANFSNVYIIVETSYGKIELENAADSKIWSDGKTDVTLDDGLQAFLKAVFGEYEASDFNGLYEHQLKANRGTRYITVDMSELNMDGLHIENEVQLKNAIAVYKALKDIEKDEVTFNLDGDEETGQFIIETKDGRDALKEAMSLAKLTLTPCQDKGEVCEEIVLRGDAALDVPEKLLFGGEVNVRLEVEKETAGKWTLGKSYYKNVKEVIVSEGAEVMFASVVCALDPTKTDGTLATTAPTLKVEKDGVVNVVNEGGFISLQLNVDNYGTINIADADLRLSGKVTMTNHIVLPENLDEITAKPYTKDFVDNLHRGKIIISGNGIATAVNTEGSMIQNYGYILLDKSNNGDPSIMLATNGVATDKKSGFDKPISADNIFGIVDCGDGGLNKGTTVGGVKGFIMSTKEGAAGTNYTVYNDAAKTSFDLGNATYIEIKKAAQWATLTVGKDKSAPTGLIVLEGVRLATETDNSTNTGATTAYLKGTVKRAGTFKVTDFEGYFGGNKTIDEKNILVDQDAQPAQPGAPGA